MKGRFFMKAVSVTAAAVFVSGCATVDRKQSIEQASQVVSQITPATIHYLSSEEERKTNDSQLQALLKNEITQAQAVQILLMNSPSFQRLLASSWREQAWAAQTGRIANPVLSFERVSTEHGLEIGRVLSFGLLELLTLPAKKNAAEQFIKASNLTLTANVVEQVLAVQHAWIDAVLAQQKQAYAQKVLKAAEASSILAKRMQGAGNFTRSQAIRQQLFYSDSAINLANAKHDWVAKKEHLVRLLGLSSEYSQALKIPSAFPVLPKAPLTSTQVGKQGVDRLDIKLAQHQYAGQLERYGVDKVSSFIDIELGLIREYERSEGGSESASGYELEFKLPLFDWGDLKREAMQANLQAAQSNLKVVLNASSSYLRQGYSAYRTAYDIAQHFRKEVEPMQQRLAEENTYLYNGMFIGVFQLIQDNRNQVKVYENAMQAQANFWKSLANLNATIVGVPASGGVNLSVTSGGMTAGEDH